MNGFAVELDALFGFQSTWTENRNARCWENNGTINIDEGEIDSILADMNGNINIRELIVRFIAGHEKGHHLQEIVWPDRNFIAEQHEMEIEADLIGAWARALQNQVIRERPIFDIVRRFNDVNQIAQPLGNGLGDSDENNPHHPWAEQRELALVRGPIIAGLYPRPLTVGTRADFANDIRLAARQIFERGL